jgi:hypothetical protein
MNLSSMIYLLQLDTTAQVANAAAQTDMNKDGNISLIELLTLGGDHGPAGTAVRDHHFCFH